MTTPVDFHALVSHYLRHNLEDRALLDQPPTEAEFEDLVRALAKNSGSVFDDRAQAIVMLVRFWFAAR